VLMYQHKFKKPPLWAAFCYSRIATESPRQ
jgi:hypothetical protein